MTCIVAIPDGSGGVWMGGDSAASDESDWSLSLCAEAKVWRAGPMLFGASGSFRVSQLIRWHMDLPHPPPEMEPLEYLTGPLVNAIRTVLQDGGALTTWDEDSTEELTGSGLVIGMGGRVFEVFYDFGIGEITNGYATTGCGALIALGALAVTERLGARKRVQLALEAAERHSAGVRGPMTYLHLEG